MANENNFSDLMAKYVDQYTSEQISLFSHYLTLMLKWNKTYNLTAITNPQDMVIRHIMDSLTIEPYLLGERIIDVGAGAGLPGIPLAIVQSHKNFTLIDSNGKKTRFLNQVKIELKLDNVEIIHSRVEKYQTKRCFNCIVTRAFSSIHDMLLQTQHLCCKDGVFLAMKGDFPEEELQEIRKGFTVRWSKRLQVPGLDAKRHLICIGLI